MEQLADKKMRFVHLAAAVILAAALCILFWPESHLGEAAGEDWIQYPIDQDHPAGTVVSMAGERYYPNKENWVYHFQYAYPYVLGEEAAHTVIRDTYQQILDDSLNTALPMFADAPDMLFDGKNEVTHDFEVMCNNGRFLSVRMRKSQTMGENGTKMTLETLTFDMAGNGDVLTLRGVVRVGDSSEQIADAVWPHLYREFAALQQQGMARQDMTEQDFYNNYLPEANFYTDEEGNAVFYFTPEMMAQPTFDVPGFSYSPAQLEALLNE